MGTTVADIITAARYVLADPDKDRWTDPRLLVLLNDGVKDLVFNTQLLSSVVYVELDSTANTYDLSDKFLQIERVQFDNVNLPMYTHSQMDAVSADWQDDTDADPKAVIYDKMDRGYLRVYPAITDADNLIEQNSLYGIITGVSITHVPAYIDYDDLDTVTSYISVYGVTVPTEVDATSDTKPLNSQFDSTLVHYIVGSALRADMDVANRQFGNEELSLYQAAAIQIKRDRSSSSTSTSDLTSDYRRI